MKPIFSLKSMVVLTLWAAMVVSLIGRYRQAGTFMREQVRLRAATEAAQDQMEVNRRTYPLDEASLNGLEHRVSMQAAVTRQLTSYLEQYSTQPDFLTQPIDAFTLRERPVVQTAEQAVRVLDVHIPEGEEVSFVINMLDKSGQTFPETADFRLPASQDRRFPWRTPCLPGRHSLRWEISRSASPQFRLFIDDTLVLELTSQFDKASGQDTSPRYPTQHDWPQDETLPPLVEFSTQPGDTLMHLTLQKNAIHHAEHVK